MDVDGLFQTGGTLVKNPRYSKRKGNTEPEYINVVDANSPAGDLASATFDNQDLDYTSLHLGNIEKYLKHDITPSKHTELDYLDTELSKAQSAWDKVGNALAQTASELTIGTALGVSNVLDFVIGGALRLTTKETNDYSNPVSKLLEQAQETVKEATPIYTKPGVSLGNGAFGDLSWWLSNMPSIASTVSLLVPARLATAGVSKLGKLAKTTKLGRTASVQSRRWLGNVLGGQTRLNAAEVAAQVGAEGTIMRIGENYQEARQTYNELLPESIETLQNMDDNEYYHWVEARRNILGDDIDYNDRNAVAKRLASRAADETFKSDMVNAVFDIWQLYALRNIGKIMNAPMRGELNRYAKLVRKYPNKTADQIKEMLDGRPLTTKIIDKVSDYTKGSAFVTLAEANEGVEEAINYAAQQEGLSYGKALLEKASKEQDENYLARSTYNRFVPFSRITADALSDYIKAPELHDAAFWGVLGGIAFQGIGSGINQIRNYRQAKERQKELRKQGVNEENIPSLTALMETPELINRRAHLDSILTGFNSVKEKVRSIRDNHIDPYNPEVKLESEEEQEIARKRVIEDYKIQLMLNSMDVGNWNITKAFINSDELSKAFVDEGIMTEEEVRQEQENNRNLANRIEKLYNQNLKTIDNAITKYADDELDLTDVPIEYFNIIARQNIISQIAAERLGQDMDNLEVDISEEENRAGVREKLQESGIDFKSLASTRVQAQVLGQLLAERDALTNSKEATTLGGQSALQMLNRKINIVSNLLRQQLTTSEDYARYLDAIEEAYSTVRTPKGEYFIEPSSTIIANIDNALANGDFTALQDLGILTAGDVSFLTHEDENGRQTYKNVANARELLYNAYQVMYNRRSDRQVKSLKDISTTLNDDYHTLALLEIEKLSELGKVATTASEVADELDRLNNSHKDMREAFLNYAMDGFQQLGKKYGKNEIKYAIDVATDGFTPSIYEQFDETEQRLFSDFIKAMNLNASMNTTLRERVFNALDLNEIYEFTEEQDIFKQAKEAQENSTKNQNPSQSTENSTIGESSQQVLQSSTSQSSAEIQPLETIMPSEEAIITAIPTTNVRIKPNIDGGITIETVSPDENGDDIAELVKTGQPNLYKLFIKNNAPKYIIEDTDLFETTSDENAVKNPTIFYTADGPILVIDKGVRLKQAGNTTGSSSTGRLSEDDDNDVRAAEILSDDLPTDVALEVMDYITKHEVYNYGELANHLREKFKDADSKRLEEIIKQQIEINVDFAEEAGRTIEVTPIDSMLMLSALDDVIDNFQTKAKLKRGLDKLFDDMFEDYKNYCIVDEYNGKKVLSFETLLRYVNNTVKNKAQADILLEAFKKILDSRKNEYLVIDSNENNSTIVANSKKSYEERTKDLLSLGTATSINVNGYLQKLRNRRDDSSTTEEEKKELEKQIESIYEVLDNTEVGQKLIYRKQEGNGQNGIDFILKTSDNKEVKIAEIPLPKKTVSHYIMSNDGWKTDIPITNGTSKHKDFVKRVLVPEKDDEIGKKLNSLFIDYKNAAPKDKAKKAKSFYDEVLKHKEFEGLLLNPNTRQAINGLLKIYDYVKHIANIYSTSNASKIQEVERNNLLSSIENWFDKLKLSYEESSKLGENGSLNIVIDSINEGNVIKLSKDKQKPVSEAIGEEQKETAELGIAIEQGKIAVSDGSIIEGTAHRGIPFLILKGKHGKVAEINITSQLLNSNNFKNNVVIKAITDEVISEFEKQLNNWGDITNNQNQLLSFLRKLVDRKYEGYTPLFQGINIEPLTGGYKGFQISYTTDNRDVKFIKFFTEFNGSPARNVQFEKGRAISLNIRARNQQAKRDAINTLKKLLKEKLYFNIDNTYITNSKDLQGFATIKDGKFVINVDGEHDHEFDSFKDFVIKNNIINAGTEPINGRNFYRPGEDGSMDRTAVTYRIINNSSLPIEESNEVITEEPVVIPKNGTYIVEHLNKLKGNKAKAILKILLKNNPQLKILNDSVIMRNLLHNNIIFVEDYTELKYKNSEGELVKVPDDAKASYSKNERTYIRPDGTSITIPADTIVLSQNWVNLANGSLYEQEKAARDIIHESVHRLLTLKENENWQEKAQKILDDLLKADLTDDLDIKVRDAYTKNGLEEFLVESLTRPDLIRLLNKIPSNDYEKVGDVVKIKKSGTLLQRIIKFVSELFNIAINKNSLLEEEYKLFNNIAKTEETKQKEEQAKQDKPKTDINNLTEVTTEGLDMEDVDYSRLDDVNVSSIENLKSRLNPDIRSKFNNLVEEGYIEITCN